MIRLAALFVLIAGPAAAHGNLPGGGGFASGFAHPFLATEHLLLLLAIGALIGRQGVRAPVVGLLLGLAGGFAMLRIGFMPGQMLILGAALLIGGALAANLPLKGAVLMAGAMLAGLMVGADTDGLTGPTALMAHAGVVIGVLAIVLNAMAGAQVGAAKLNGVPLRVAGSWIAAAAVMILAFLMRGVLDIA
jgi:urease accessory protein